MKRRVGYAEEPAHCSFSFSVNSSRHLPHNTNTAHPVGHGRQPLPTVTLPASCCRGSVYLGHQVQVLRNHGYGRRSIVTGSGPRLTTLAAEQQVFSSIAISRGDIVDDGLHQKPSAAVRLHIVTTATLVRLDQIVSGTPPVDTCTGISSTSVWVCCRDKSSYSLTSSPWLPWLFVRPNIRSLRIGP